MILAGVDEAGLGPTLGPLVTAYSAMRVPDGWTLASPWEALESVITNKPLKRETRVTVGDSKVVHSRLGVEGLARTLAAFAPLVNHARDASCESAEQMTLSKKTPASIRDMLTVLCDELWHDCTSYPWYANFQGDAPLLSEKSMSMDEAARQLAEACANAEITPLFLRSIPMLAGAFNEGIASGLNKSELTMRQTGICLARIVTTFPNESMEIMVDRQGGRAYYHPFLMQTFPGAWIDILHESPAESAYRLRRERDDVVIRFRPKADGEAFCVALASMAAKWTRESLMVPLNDFFVQRLPGLKPTAGYPEDAKRFLTEINQVLIAESIDTSRLIRVR